MFSLRKLGDREDLSPSTLLDQDNFYDVLLHDLQGAKYEVIIVHCHDDSVLRFKDKEDTGTQVTSQEILDIVGQAARNHKLHLPTRP